VTDGVTIRPYDPGTDTDTAAGEADSAELWGLKRRFELGLGTETGGDDKAAAYADKLTPRYRRRWLAWVRRCVADDPGCVVVAEADAGVAAGSGASPGVEGPATAGLVGYAFLLPESLAFVWDAAVLNELYVVPGCRGTGVADALFDAVIDRARSQDLPLDRLVLDVDAENDRARAFYRRHGFEPWGEMVAKRL